MAVKRVRPSLVDSSERLCQQTCQPRCLLDLAADEDLDADARRSGWSASSASATAPGQSDTRNCSEALSALRRLVLVRRDAGRAPLFAR
nr:hypothetical protein [uncultured Jannaschia sp.]